MLKLRKNKKGFTLVELIVVIAIMAVLAGTVAGVTVSQLNKQTDNANKTQAKKVADQIASLIIGNDIVVVGEGVAAKFQIPADGKDAAQDLTADNLKSKFIEDEFPGLIKSTGKGEISLSVSGTEIKVIYTPKGNKGVTYKINAQGIVSE